MVSNTYTTAAHLHSPVARLESFAATVPAFLVKHTAELYAAISSVNLSSGTTYAGPLFVFMTTVILDEAVELPRREICRNVLSKKKNYAAITKPHI